MGAQDDVVETVDGGVGEERVVQHGRAILALEFELERVLEGGAVRPPAGAPDPQAAIDLERGAAVGFDPFHRSRPLPRLAGVVGERVNAIGCAEEAGRA